jgi:hypothetical protein
VEAGSLALKKKPFNPPFPSEKPVPSQGHYSFPVEDFRYGLFMDDGLCISIQTITFVFSNFVITLIC